MHAAAAAAFPDEMGELEGKLRHLYFDTHKDDDGNSRPLATTGIGVMVDTGSKLTQLGLTLPWRTAGGDYTTELQADAEYHRLKELGIESQGGAAYGKHATLWLDEPVVDWLLQTKAGTMERYVAGWVPGWAALRASSQLATMSAVWNVGENMLNPKSARYWPNFAAALKAEDYVTAADHCLIGGTKNLLPVAPSRRNRRNRILHLQAARDKLRNMPPTLLRLPTITLSLANLNAAAAKPDAFDSTAWWVQNMLRITGVYRSALDGKWGPVSRNALGAHTVANLVKLAGASGLMRTQGDAVTVTA